MAKKKFIQSIYNIMRSDPGITNDTQRIEQIGWMLFLKVYDAREHKWELQEGLNSIIPENLRWRTWANKKTLSGKTLLNFVNKKLFPGLKNLPITPETPRRQAFVRTVFEGINQYMQDGDLLRQAIDLINEVNFEDEEENRTFCETYETFLRDLQSTDITGDFYTPTAVADFVIGHISSILGRNRRTITDLSAGACCFLVAMLKKMERKAKTKEDFDLVCTRIYGAEKNPLAYLLGVTNLLLHGVDTPKIYHGDALKTGIRDQSVGRFNGVIMKPPFDSSEPEEVLEKFFPLMRSKRTADLFAALTTYRLSKTGQAALILPDTFLSGMEPQQLAIKKRILKNFNLHTIIRLPASTFAPYSPIATTILFFKKGTQTKYTWFYRVDMPDGYKHFTKTKPILLEHFAECEQWWMRRCPIPDGDISTFKARRYSLEELIERDYNLDLCGYPKEKK